ncbi:hypothetical protein GZH47_02790 [Paenibacillus rhizovicinus]|uniref:Uncharacterized protein n=1 Tax=Paenibacillus rhizovicinus TaxID=2704463 RepID=A0A6C0NUS0_9BACL|nr:hypothetical protein [Paenibacillus rhizovicinus]QHW29861.1 hypothetical protein GZH47_02790 [Paenibacillus rhizovicinus]
MSRHIWKSAASEAADSGRDVISLLVSSIDSSEEPVKLDGQELAEAIRNALFPLDSRWSANMRRASASIRKDNNFDVALRSDDGIRLVSSGTADLFGLTPATKAAQKLFEFMQSTRDIDSLRASSQHLHAPAVLAYGKLLRALLNLRAAIIIELAAPAGPCRETELSVQQLQDAVSYIEETEISSIFLRVRGSLQAFNPAGKLFLLEGEDGRRFTGRITKEIAQHYTKAAPITKLPILSEALIERRTAYQASIDAASTVDILTELDTDPGENREELEARFQKVYNRLKTALAHEDDYLQTIPVSAADYSELTELTDRLLASNPSKGARRTMDSSDLTDLHMLLAESKPIGRLALSDEGDFEDTDDIDADHYVHDPSARAAKSKAAAERSRLASAAFADSVKLAGRLLKVIDALHDDTPI